MALEIPELHWNPESNWNSFSWLKKFQNQTGIRILSNSSLILEKNIVTKINVQNETGKRVDWLIMWQQTPGLAWFWFQFQSGISRAHYIFWINNKYINLTFKSALKHYNLYAVPLNNQGTFFNISIYVLFIVTCKHIAFWHTFSAYII